MERATLQLRVLGQSAGEPVPQAKVRISPAGGGRWRDLITDNNGHAEAAGFDPGDYIVTIDHADFALGRERITLRRGENDVRIKLVAPVDVELRLRTTSGEVIPNASVGLKRANGELFGFPVGGQKVSEKLLQNGVVKLKRVPAEVVTLLVDRQGEVRVEQPLDLRVESGSVVDVWLNPPPSAGMVMILVAVVIVISTSGWIALRPRKS
jgi:hypothetical protein